MKSMTGFAKTQCSSTGRIFNIEIKTLNSKQLDLNIKIPSALREFELEMRQQLSKLERGKVDVVITEQSEQIPDGSLNLELVRSRYQSVLSFCKEIGVDSSSVASILLTQSDVWHAAQVEETIDWNPIKACVDEAIAKVDAFREHEGGVLFADFNLHVDAIEKRLNSIPAFEAERIETAKERIRHYLSELPVAEIDANRFEQELIYYLEKLDITEEKVRLAKHITYFRETMLENPCGKKLAFVAQEMGREINTIGSKANHVDIQKLVVEMKDELEKIKEQLGNIL